LDGFGTFSLTVDGNVAKTAQDAGIEKQFNKLKINFNPAVELKEKLANVDVELDGIWRCVDIEAENKVVISAGSTVLRMEGSGSMSVSSDTSMKMKSSKITVDGDSTEVKAGGSLKLSSGGQASLKASVVKLN
jgi:hypothetical protein